MRLLREDFSYAMVHDMKSPLTSIIMGTKYLHSGVLLSLIHICQQIGALKESVYPFIIVIGFLGILLVGIFLLDELAGRIHEMCIRDSG